MRLDASIHLDGRYGVAAFLSFLLAGCAVTVTQPQDTPVAHFSKVDPATGRLYYIYVPSTYRGDRPCPLIISCHGTPPYDVAEHHIREWKMLAETNGCIVVAPTLIGTDGLLGDGPVVGMLADERYIISIISRLGKRYAIDRDNIMLTGFGGGGFPTYWVGLRHPDIFSVVVARSCNFNEHNLEGWFEAGPDKSAVMVYHGEKDIPAIVEQSESAVRYLRTKGYAVETAVLPNARHERHPEVAMAFFRKHWRTSGANFTVTPDNERMATAAEKPVPSDRQEVARRFAVIVGLGRYKHAGKWHLDDLRYATEDAREMAEYLTGTASLGFSVQTLLDEDATSTNIKVALRERLRGVQPDDLVLFFWAGHGAPDPHEPNKLYLITYDTDPEHMASTAYAMDEFRRDIASIRAGRVIVIADACHSGGIFDPAIGIRGPVQNTIVNGLRGVYVGDEAGRPTTQTRLVFTSSEQGQVSQESEKLGHGVFTYYLLQGLKGEADKPENKTGGNGDGKIALGELIEYTRDQVKRFTENQQHPSTAGQFDRNLVISEAK